MINGGVPKVLTDYDYSWNSIYSRSAISKYMDKNEFTRYMCPISPCFDDKNHTFDHSEDKL